MLLTLTTTHVPATDLGYLLAKHPDRLQTFDVTGGLRAHVFYPEATPERCTAALLLAVDPVALVRRPQGTDDFALAGYTNDRPYVASSFLSTAIARVFGAALGGRSRERPDLAAQAIPLEATLAVVPARGGESLLARLFEPLGYAVESVAQPLDAAFPDWGDSPYHTLTLRGCVRLAELLNHLYVLIPVLDDDKHYWVGEAEVEKLLAHGEGWLAGHPERQLILRRSFRGQRSLAREALRRLTDEAVDQGERQRREEALEAPLRLNDVRLDAVAAALRASGAGSVIDLGCGEGRLLERLLDADHARVVGVDVSAAALERAARRLRLDEMPERRRARLDLFQAALTYRDDRLAGFDAAAVVEVIEHLEPDRLEAFERVVFEHARPGLVVLTTPNAEFNACFPSLPAGRFRHPDHRFEWTRAEFRGWAEALAARQGYTVDFADVGPVVAALGAPTQMGVFRR